MKDQVMLSCRVPRSLRDKLDHINTKYGVKKQFLVQRAICQYLNDCYPAELTKKIKDKI